MIDRLRIALACAALAWLAVGRPTPVEDQGDSPSRFARLDVAEGTCPKTPRQGPTLPIAAAPESAQLEAPAPTAGACPATGSPITASLAPPRHSGPRGPPSFK